MTLRTAVLILSASWAVSAAMAAPSTDAVERDLGRRFDGAVRPFLGRFCLGCHDKEKPKGDFDQEILSTLNFYKRKAIAA